MKMIFRTHKSAATGKEVLFHKTEEGNTSVMIQQHRGLSLDENGNFLEKKPVMWLRNLNEEMLPLIEKNGDATAFLKNYGFENPCISILKSSKPFKEGQEDYNGFYYKSVLTEGIQDRDITTEVVENEELIEI